MVLQGCVRIFLFLINTLTVIFGFAITAIGIYCVSKSKTEPFNDMETGSLVGFIVFTLFIGIFVLTLGLLGLFGSITQSPSMMIVYGGLIVVVLILELALLVGSLCSKNKIVETAREGFRDYVTRYYEDGIDDNVKQAVDAIQFNLKCCGYGGQDDFRPDHPPPASCCSDDTVTSFDECPTDDRFDEGCKMKFPKFIGDVLNLFAVVIGFAVILDVISMMGACYVRQNSPKYNHIA
ncbi:23 kDa integral membrane protein-like [Bolinopsis microptera]|uniref:23 kDa integral membrane protein-like n=1 Tax=Bolinopsis microptera TaxID=2820187 RepID=UPI00307AED1F